MTSRRCNRCRRSAIPDWAICEACFADLFQPARKPSYVARLSATDPMCQRIAAELKRGPR